MLATAGPQTLVCYTARLEEGPTGSHAVAYPTEQNILLQFNTAGGHGNRGSERMETVPTPGLGGKG
jgi:hypothetical protein